MLIRLRDSLRCPLIEQTTLFSQNSWGAEEKTPDLDDPFRGVLGQGSSRDALWLGKAAPRYTSYPPATAFQDGVAPEEYKAVLAALPPEEPVSLYLHVPFCRALCLYCGCHTAPTQQHERVANYLEFVHRELEHVALTSARARRVARVHFGGGSPNIMSEKDMGLMFGALVRRFDLSSCEEIAMELDPRLMTKAQVRTLRMIGVTRVSLGVQDFDPEVQDAIGRVQPYDMVESACGLLREHDIKNISFDLLYGLPIQSPVSIADTARRVVALRPSRVSLFSYAHMPQSKKHQKVLEQYVMPGPYAALALERAARAVLCDAGYVEIGMDHFALPEDSLAKAAMDKRLRRNFQGYTDDASAVLLGLGSSAIGRLASRYFQNEHDTDGYQKTISAKGFATKRGLKLFEEDKLRAEIIESLLCYMTVNLEDMCRKHNYALSSLGAELEALADYEKAGIISRNGYKIALAIPQRMAVRAVASLFDVSSRDAPSPSSRIV